MQKISRMLLIPLLMFSLFASAQTRKISGKVVGNNNEPVAGASISVKGSSAGASANNEGNFVLEARGAVTLIVSGIGFNSIEVPVSADQLTVNIVLTPAQGFTQSEIVVTSFGMTRSKRALGYSVTQVGGDRFTESRTANIGNALSGKVAGVNVSTPASGAGGSSRVLIRGGSSLLGNDQPLYVINGVPM